MKRLIYYPCAAAIACGTAPALAVEVAVSSDASTVGPTTGPSTAAVLPAGTEIIVTGRHLQYGVRSTSTATKTATDVKDIPQALTVITSGQIADQQLRS